MCKDEIFFWAKVLIVFHRIVLNRIIFGFLVRTKRQQNNFSLDLIKECYHNKIYSQNNNVECTLSHVSNKVFSSTRDSLCLGIYSTLQFLELYREPCV